MATRVLAQVLVAGATVLMRAGAQAWAQALQNAQRTGVASEAAKQASRAAASKITAEEARMILNVDSNAGWPEVVKRYKHLFEVNEKQGSFYLQSKVFRAMERLEQEYEAEGKKTPDPEQEGSASQAAATGQQQQQQEAGQQGSRQ